MNHKRQNKMRTKIQNSMVIILILTLLSACGLYSFVSYYHNLTLLKESVQREAQYIVSAVETTGIEHLEEMDLANPAVRVTLIDSNGKVLYESWKNEAEMDNHKRRSEIQDALKQGVGERVRVSDSIKKSMYYYAVLLDNGQVLRVASTMDSLTGTAVKTLPVFGILAGVMLVIAYLLAKIRTIQLIKPINELDVKEPLANPMYEELIPLLESIDRQNQEKDAVADMRKEFSANVSHELKTPLTSISGYAEIMMNGLVPIEDMPAFSERIYKEAKRLITLVEDIIKLSRLDEGSIELEKEDVDLYNLAREIVARLSQQAQEKEVSIYVQGEPVVYRGIRQILDEMIYNICENAVKYNQFQGAVTVWVGQTLQGIKIVVSDTGIGIPKEHQDRIFERFYRVDKSHSRATGGTGLGLSIVKHGAMLHGAKIFLESEAGQGCRIELVFPKES